MRVVAVVCLFAWAAMAAGCGTSGSKGEVDSAVDRFQAALAADDGAGACGELSPVTREELATREKKPCAEAILGVDLDGGGRARETRVYMTSAISHVPGRAYLFLDQTAGGWRISAAGCKPVHGDEPYDCEVED